MVDEMRRQLDALMGMDRNKQGRIKRFTDDDVCVYFLCGCCPHEMFVNTKKDLGLCPKLHSEPLRNEYEQARRTKDYGFERELLRKLEDMVRDCDREVERQARKLQEEEEQKLEHDPISRQIADLQQQAERLGEEGKVDEYMKISAQIEKLKDQRVDNQVQLPDGVAGQVIQQHGRQSQQQKLKVCEICGCFLSKFDSDARLADHFKGKLHSGFQAIREKIDELKSQGITSPTEDRRSGSTRIGHSYDRSREPYSRPRDQGVRGGRRDFRDGRDDHFRRDRRDSRGEYDRERDRGDRERERGERDRGERERGERERDRGEREEREIGERERGERGERGERDRERERERDYRDRDRDRDYRHQDRSRRDRERSLS